MNEKVTGFENILIIVTYIFGFASLIMFVIRQDILSDFFMSVTSFLMAIYFLYKTRSVVNQWGKKK